MRVTRQEIFNNRTKLTYILSIRDSWPLNKINPYYLSQLQKATHSNRTLYIQTDTQRLETRYKTYQYNMDIDNDYMTERGSVRGRNDARKICRRNGPVTIPIRCYSCGAPKRNRSKPIDDKADNTKTEWILTTLQI